MTTEQLENRKRYQREYQKSRRERMSIAERQQFDRNELAKKLLRDPEFNLRKRAKRYGLSIEQYRSLLECHHNSCAICGRVEVELKASDPRGGLVIDHDHATGPVRGILCSTHNKALGMFSDNAALLEKAIAYLKGK